MLRFLKKVFDLEELTDEEMEIAFLDGFFRACLQEDSDMSGKQIADLYWRVLQEDRPHCEMLGRYPRYYSGCYGRRYARRDSEFRPL